MNKIKSLSLLFLPLLLLSCKTKSVELFPCMCDNKESTLGILSCMCERPAEKKPEEISFIRNVQPDRAQREAYAYLHHSRDRFAPLQLEVVDFRIPKETRYDQFNTKLGNYRFRIFGCRRFDREVYLNRGRAMQRDMKFFEIFYENMNEYYPVVVDKNNPYYVYSDKVQPEYILTAEINDYFMNVCDEYDWNSVSKQNLRTGTSEMTVTWRLMDLTKDHVYCKVTTTGYGEVKDGEYNGEIKLVERAFEDALQKLPQGKCFNNELAKRIRPEELKKQQQILLSRYQAQEGRADDFRSQYAPELTAINMMQSCASDVPYVLTQFPYMVSEVSYIPQEAPYTLIDEAYGSEAYSKGLVEEFGGVKSSGMVLDKGCKSVKLEDGCTTVRVTDSSLKLVDDYWVDLPLNDAGHKAEVNRAAMEEAFSNANNKFCIQNQPPYQDMRAENLYKVRAAVVSVANPAGKKGAGLLVSDQLILTSADLLLKDNNNFDIQTINGLKFKASAFRVNPNKNVALLLLEDKAQFNPLPLRLDLPEVGKEIFMTLGLLDIEKEGEGYLDNEGKVTGYKYTEERGAEIVVDTYVQAYTLGGALIDNNGNIVGLAHSDKAKAEDPDLFIPIETALKSLGLSICGRPFVNQDVTKMAVIDKPITRALETIKAKEPEAMNAKERK